MRTSRESWGNSPSDEGKRLREVKQLTLEAGETRLIFYEPFTWQGEPLRSEIGAVNFAGKDQGDSPRTPWSHLPPEKKGIYRKSNHSP